MRSYPCDPDRPAFQVAFDLLEAREQAAEGFGYHSKEEAAQAIIDSKADPFYKSRLKVFEVKAK